MVKKAGKKAKVAVKDIAKAVSKQFCTHNCISVKGLAFSLGVIWGIAVLLLGLSAWLFGYGNVVVALIGELYIGYGPDLVGSLIGLIYGLVDGAVLGALVAWLYNKFTNCCS